MILNVSADADFLSATESIMRCISKQCLIQFFRIARAELFIHIRYDIKRPFLTLIGCHLLTHLLSAENRDKRHAP